MKKTIIWDFEDTLAYRPEGLWVPALQEVIRQVDSGREVDAAQIRPHLQSGFPWLSPERPHLEIQTADQWWEALEPFFARVFATLGFDSARAQSMALQVRPVFTNPAKWTLYPDTLATLDELSAQGWAHVILSNHVPELGEVVRYLGLEPHFARLFNSADIGYEKPHPQAFQIVLQALPPSGLRCMIGDSPVADVEGARAVGLPAILVHKHHPQADHFCETLSQVPTILGSIFNLLK